MKYKNFSIGELINNLISLFLFTCLLFGILVYFTYDNSEPYNIFILISFIHVFFIRDLLLNKKE